MSPHRRDLSYERDTINKVVKINELDDEMLMDEGQKSRSSKFARTIGSP